MLDKADKFLEAVLQNEGTFVKGFPIKSIYIVLYFSVCALGILAVLGGFLYEMLCNNEILYGFLFGMTAMFLCFTVPAFILLYFNYGISRQKRAILSDGNSFEVSVIPYKVYTDIKKGKNSGFKLEIKFEYCGKEVVIQTAGLFKKTTLVKPNEEIRIVYSPKYNDALIKR